jgi:hypothetical protein
VDAEEYLKERLEAEISWYDQRSEPINSGTLQLKWSRLSALPLFPCWRGMHREAGRASLSQLAS